MRTKFLSFLKISSVVFAILFLLFNVWFAWTNVYTGVSVNGDENNMFYVAKGVEKATKAFPIQKRSDFDILMHYILHPQTKCKSSIVLGGVPFRNTKKIDGDKIICLQPARKLEDPCIVYSFGISSDWSFEEAIQKKYGCKVFAFDPSIRTEKNMHSENIWFFKLGLSYKDRDKFVRKKLWKMNTFEAIKKQLNHTEDQIIDVVKMDIEGSEFRVLENMLDTGMLNNVNHLCVEIHLMSLPRWERVYRMMKRIEEEAGLYHFSTRNNTIAGYGKVPREKNRKECLLFELAWFRY